MTDGEKLAWTICGFIVIWAIVVALKLTFGMPATKVVVIKPVGWPKKKRNAPRLCVKHARLLLPGAVAVIDPKNCERCK